jgi:hypothetical protein
VRQRAFLVAAVIAAAAVTSACGVQQASGDAGGSASPSPGSHGGLTPLPGGTAHPGCQGARPTPPGHTLTLNVGANGQTFCVKPGARVFVVLQGSPGRTWSPIHVSPPSVLAPRADGRLALMVGATGASFAAVHPGSAAITSGRKVCAGSVSAGSSPAPASPGLIAGCDVVLTFQVTVIVRR